MMLKEIDGMALLSKISIKSLMNGRKLIKVKEIKILNLIKADKTAIKIKIKSRTSCTMPS